MPDKTTTECDGDLSGMYRKQITLKDGRYMIFYTFDEEPATETSGAGEAQRQPQPMKEAGQEP